MESAWYLISAKLVVAVTFTTYTKEVMLHGCPIDQLFARFPDCNLVHPLYIHCVSSASTVTLCFPTWAERLATVKSHAAGAARNSSTWMCALKSIRRATVCHFQPLKQTPKFCKQSMGLRMLCNQRKGACVCLCSLPFGGYHAAGKPGTKASTVRRQHMLAGTPSRMAVEVEVSPPYLILYFSQKALRLVFFLHLISLIQ